MNTTYGVTNAVPIGCLPRIRPTRALLTEVPPTGSPPPRGLPADLLPADLLLAGRELQHVPRGTAVLAGRVHRHVLRIAERVRLSRRLAGRGRHRYCAPLRLSLVRRDRPGTHNCHRGGAVDERVTGVLLP